jgi:hypothetical protein
MKKLEILKKFELLFQLLTTKITTASLQYQNIKTQKLDEKPNCFFFLSVLAF